MAIERNLKLLLAYDGSAYNGFQRQANAVAVQNVLEDRLSRIFGERISLRAAGRTDAGVHALGQVVSFTTTGSIPTASIVRAAASVLPPDIVVRSAEEVPPEFDALRAHRKTYVYRLWCGEPSPFLRNFAWQLGQPLNVSAVRVGLAYLLGTHDFTSFRTGSDKTPTRTVYRADLDVDGDELRFTFRANGFLYHMARNFVGTLAEVGLGQRKATELGAILSARDRAAAGRTAPAAGLYLMSVDYVPLKIDD